MKKDMKNTSFGITTLGALGVSFIVLKLTHTIDWSWWWVLAPFWAGPAIGLAVFLGLVAYGLIRFYNGRDD